MPIDCYPQRLQFRRALKQVFQSVHVQESIQNTCLMFACAYLTLTSTGCDEMLKCLLSSLGVRGTNPPTPSCNQQEFQCM